MEPQTPIQAVLIDTVSIQKYIFASNKLKENLGASYLVETIYGSLLEGVLNKLFSEHSQEQREQWFSNWKEHPENILLEEGEPFDVGYIGGGNALLLFRVESQAHDFIREWSAQLLVKAPGITTAIALQKVPIKDLKQEFDTVHRKLRQELEANQAKFSPQTTLPRHGITAEGSRRGLSIELLRTVEGESTYVSSVTAAKLDAAPKAKTRQTDQFSTVLGDQYAFTDEMNELGQHHQADSHLAVVHIDGNDMGRRFQSCATLQALRELSKRVKKITEHAFQDLLQTITANFDKIKREVHIATDGKNEFLPIRSIILGGDDVTFVCDGRLGIYFAQTFMQAFAERSQNEFSSCAGISIVRTKFPFFRAYELAEQLCKSAKTKWHVRGRQGSWMDFHLTYGGFSGKLQDIRRDHYTLPWKSDRATLLFRPYCVEEDSLYSLGALIKNASALKQNFPNLKINELRTVLAQGQEAARTFVKEQDYRQRKLPEISGRSFESDLFDTREVPYANMEQPNEPRFETPYFDVIEFLECYPSFALQPQKEVNNEELTA